MDRTRGRQLEPRSDHLSLDTWNQVLRDSNYPHRDGVMRALRETGYINVDMDINKDERTFQTNHLSSLVFAEGVETLIAKATWGA